MTKLRSFNNSINFELMHTLQIDNTLQQFVPIHLSEMDEVRLMNRIDTKFAFCMEDLLKLLPELQKDYYVFEIENTRTPQYKSLYFDSDSFKFYHDHHNQKMSRFKVRIREYVESRIHFFEIKHKFKGKTFKKRIPINGFEEVLNAKELDFLKQVNVDEINLNACLWNSFRRITLVHKKRKERLTLDFNLEFSWEGKIENFPNLIIAELKQERLNRNSEFYELMKKELIRPYRLSKYCIGSIQLHKKKGLKYNRFKEKLNMLKFLDRNAA